VFAFLSFSVSLFFFFVFFFFFFFQAEDGIRDFHVTGVQTCALPIFGFSQAEFRQAKYVYDWVKPSLANRYMTLGRVKASDRKMRSGSCRLSSVITHSQNGNDLVWGLSTRKIFTPSAIQNSKTPFSACHSPSG